MQTESEQKINSATDRNISTDDGGSLDYAKTPKYFIKLAANKMVQRILGLQAVKQKPHLIPEINKLLDLDILYAMALIEQKSHYTDNMEKFIQMFLPKVGLKKSDIPADDLIKIQSAIQLIYGIFKDQVFNNEIEKSKFNLKKVE